MCIPYDIIIDIYKIFAITYKQKIETLHFFIFTSVLFNTLYIYI